MVGNGARTFGRRAGVSPEDREESQECFFEALEARTDEDEIRLLSRAVFALPDAARVIVQPAAENAASRAALTAAGYRFDAENGVFILQRADLGA